MSYMKWQNKTVLVTGATDFVCPYLVRETFESKALVKNKIADSRINSMSGVSMRVLLPIILANVYVYILVSNIF